MCWVSTFAAESANPHPTANPLLGAPYGFQSGAPLAGSVLGSVSDFQSGVSSGFSWLGGAGLLAGSSHAQDSSDVGPLVGSSGASVLGVSPACASDPRGAGSGLRFGGGRFWASIGS